jgi:hypothetical protein
MSKKRKKRRKKEKKEASQKKASLIKRVVDSQYSNFNYGKIPEGVAIMNKKSNDGEAYSISFLHYAEKECEVKKMSDKKDNVYLMTSLLLLKKIGFYGDKLTDLIKEGFRIDVVKNGNEYKKLYNKLKRDDVDIKETAIYEAHTKKTGRVFFWTSVSKRIIYIIAIRKTHYK